MSDPRPPGPDTVPDRADPDVYGSAAHQLMSDHLTGPLQAGATGSRVAVSEAGTVEVTRPTRAPLILAMARSSIDDTDLHLTADTDDGTSTHLVFARGTESGACLPVHSPRPDPSSGMALPFQLQLSLTRVGEDERQAVPAERIGDLIDIRLVEGTLGRLLYVLGAETARLRREARLLARVRTLAGAFGDALDRIGADLGVPRLHSTIGFQEGTGIEITDEQRREPDVEYRRRLAIYQPWTYPSLGQIRVVLNGPGPPPEENTGLLGTVGVTQRFTVTDSAAPSAFAVHLLAVDAPEALGRFSDYIRRTRLIWPEDSTLADEAHEARYLPTQQRQDIDDLRSRLRDSFTLPTGAALAPQLAHALDRVARCRRALGIVEPWPLVRAQDITAGSRYQLGLGCDLAPADPALLEEMRQRLLDATIDLPDGPTPEEPDPEQTRAILGDTRPAPADIDPDGSWLLTSCGLATVHRVSDARIYVSHIPTFGLSIHGVTETATDTPTPLTARYHAAGEPGSHRLLVEALTSAAQDWADLGGDAWTVLSDDESTRLLDTDVVPFPRQMADILTLAELPAVRDPTATIAELRTLPPELLTTLRLSADTFRRLAAGDPDVVDELRGLVKTLSRHGISSALPLLTRTSGVLLVVGGTGLPGAGTNLAERNSAFFRWHAAPIWPAQAVERELDDVVSIGYLGATTEVTASRPGLYAISHLGRIRRQGGDPEPYEFSLDLPADTQLDLLQFEYLMNLLDHVHPAGTRANTWSIRQDHVDVDGDGTPEALSPTEAMKYRRFQHRR